MRRFLLCALVIIITFITVLSMFTFKNNNISQTYIEDEEVINNNTLNYYEGTGYIFDDYGKGINIPIN